MVEDIENPDRKCGVYFQALNKPSELAEEDKIKNLKVLKEFVESFGLNIDLE